MSNIPEIYKEHAYVLEDGTVFLPIYDKSKKMVMTGYEYYLSTQEQINISPVPTSEDRILKLEEEKSILAENVYQLASILEIMLGGVSNE